MLHNETNGIKGGQGRDAEDLEDNGNALVSLSYWLVIGVVTGLVIAAVRAFAS